MDCQPSTSRAFMESSTNESTTAEAIKLTAVGQNIAGIKLGDIVWSKIRGYPFWPSIVCIDPTEQIFIKEQRDTFFSLHVRFLNDKCQRSWSNNIEVYCGVDVLLKNHPNCVNTLRKLKKKKKQWDEAVMEAEHLIALNLEVRKLKFAKDNSLPLSSLFHVCPKPLIPVKDLTAQTDNVEHTNTSKKRKTAKERKKETPDQNTVTGWMFYFPEEVMAAEEKNEVVELITEYVAEFTGGITNKKPEDEDETFYEKFSELTLAVKSPSPYMVPKYLKKSLNVINERQQIEDAERLLEEQNNSKRKKT